MPDPNQKPDPQVVGLDAARLGLSVPSGGGGEDENLRSAAAMISQMAGGGKLEIKPGDVEITLQRVPPRKSLPIIALVVAASAAARAMRRETAAWDRGDLTRGLGYDQCPQDLRDAAVGLEHALLGMAIPILGPDRPGSLPEYLAAERASLGLSFESWADLLGVHPATVRRWEGGATLPGFEDLRRLVEIGLDPTVLLDLPARRET